MAIYFAFLSRNDLDRPGNFKRKYGSVFREKFKKPLDLFRHRKSRFKRISSKDIV